MAWVLTHVIARLGKIVIFGVGNYVAFHSVADQSGNVLDRYVMGGEQRHEAVPYLAPWPATAAVL
jgi:hypothetical protein